MEIKHVTGIRFAAGRALQNERHLAVGHGVLGKIIINDQRIHTVIHEPFANSRTDERSEILVGGGIRGGGDNHDCVGQRAGFFEHANHAGDVRLLLADGHVNVIDRAEAGVTGGFGGLVDARLIDHGVHANRGLAGGTVANDQFALTAADRDHRVDGHDAGLHGLAHTAALDDAGGDFFNGIESGFLDGSFAIKRLAERVDHAAEHALANGNLEEFAGGADFGALFHRGVVTQDDGADFGLFKVQRKADDAIAEVEHLIEHRVGETFDLGHAVADFANGADVLFGRRGLDARDLGFDFLQQITHSIRLKILLQFFQPRFHAAIIKITAHLDAQPADEGGVPPVLDVQPRAVGFCETGLDGHHLVRGGIHGVFHPHRAPGNFQLHQPVHAGHDPHVTAGLLFQQQGDRLADAVLIENAIDEAAPEELARVALDLLGNFHPDET